MEWAYKPVCVLCVYERLAMIGLFAAGVLALLQPRVFILRLIAWF